MKLGLSIGYSGAHLALPVERVQLAERLGFDSVWTAEAYGSDAVTPLAYLAAVTTRIRLGTGIMQLAARTPAAAAMAMGTLDALAGGGRVIAGLGVSGPQIVEGWYGQPWGRPYWRLRDYVAIMRKIFERKGPVTHAGKEIALPYEGPGSAGLAKPLTSILHMNPRIPIWLGTGTEANVKLAAEVADGWLPLGFTPSRMPKLRAWLEEGLRRAGGGKTLADLEIQPGVSVLVTDDVRVGLATLKPRVALYVGGMGHRSKNFHKQMMVERGYGAAAERIQELYLAHKKDEAVAAVPDDFVDDAALVGPPERIRGRYRAWADCGITGMTIATQQVEAMELMAGLAGSCDLPLPRKGEGRVRGRPAPMSHDARAIEAHWARAGLAEAILAALAAAGKNLDALTIEDLAPTDQFHGGGKPATLRLARLAGAVAGMRVLDVGGGLGGPARTLAVELGCQVTVVDLTESYVRAAQMLTTRLGLGDRVRHQIGDALALPFDAGAFDMVWTQNSGMNIADKARLYAGFHRVLRAGGRLATQEPMAGPVQPPIYPVMWARDASGSFLQAPEAMHALIERTGFRALAWDDVTAETAGTMGAAPPAHAVQRLIMGEALPAIVAAGQRNREEGRIVMVQAVFDRLP